MKGSIVLMLIGGHFPISKGLNNSIVLSDYAGANTLQIFTKNPSQWKGRDISIKEAKSFINFAREKNISPIIVHSSYLINLASYRDELRNKSIKALIDEVNRARLIGSGFIVLHMGSHNKKGEKIGLNLLSDSLNYVLREIKNIKVKILLETTAGQGSQLGYNFEHFAYVIDKCKGNKQLGVCIDTCHIFAAGYNISDSKGYEKTFEEFDKMVGWNRLGVIHLNDSKKALGSRVDRHELLGKGYIGLNTFKRIVNDPNFRHIPIILETPNPEKMHKIQIKILKSLIKNS